MARVQEQSVHQRSLSSLVVMCCTLTTRVLGFLKFVVISAIFGGQGAVDILNAVLSIPNNLRKLMAEGALSTAFIPSLSKKLVDGDEAGAHKLARQILGLQWLILLPVVLLVIIFHQSVIPAFVHFKNAQDMSLAGVLLAWVAPYILIVSISAVLMAVLNSHNRFFVAALCPMLFSLAIIITTMLFHKTLGIFSMVLGVLLGGLGQLFIQYPSYHKLGYSLLPQFSLRDPDILTVIRRWGPIVATSSVFTINQQIAVFLASRLPAGSTTALTNAIVFFQLPFGIFSATVNTVYYPQISRYVHQQTSEPLKESLTSGLRLLLVTLLPSGFLLALLGHEIISVAFMRGAFKAKHVALATSTLRGFCWGMFFTAAYNFIQRYFYAKGYMRAPFVSAFLACFIDVILSLWLIHTPLGVAGLAYANSLAFFISSFSLFFVLHYKYKNIKLKPLLLEALKVCFVLACVYGLYLELKRVLGTTYWQQGACWASFKFLLLYVAILGVAILLGYQLLGIKLLELIKRKKSLT